MGPQYQSGSKLCHASSLVTALSTLLRPLLARLHCEHPWDAARSISGPRQPELHRIQDFQRGPCAASP